MSTSHENLLSLVKSQEFLQLWEIASERCFSWEEFRTYPMPYGMFAEDVWELIVVLRKHSSYRLPFVSYLPSVSGAEPVWFSLPHKTQLLLQRISDKTNSASLLSDIVLANKSYYFQSYLMFYEFLSVLQRDGITISPGRAKELLFSELKPLNQGEVVFLNLCDAFFRALDFAKKKITRGTIENLCDLLWDDETIVFESITRLKETRNQDTFTTNYTLDVVCELANSFPDSLVHPVISGLSIASMFWDHKPLPQLNASVALLVMKLVFYRYNYPALAFVPLSRASREWELGTYVSITPLPSFEDTLLCLDSGQGLDSTEYHSSILTIYEQELQNFTSRIERFLLREKKLEESIFSAEGLNGRQKALMLTILRDPFFTTSIKAFCEHHKVAYSTGRKDLVEMADRNYLAYKKEGQAFCFAVGSEILTLLSLEQSDVL